MRDNFIGHPLFARMGSLESLAPEKISILISFEDHE